MRKNSLPYQRKKSLTFAKYLLEIFELRYDQQPTIFCSQYRTGEGHPRLGGGVVADAIIDRIAHNSTTINAE